MKASNVHLLQTAIFSGALALVGIHAPAHSAEEGQKAPNCALAEFQDQKPLDLQQFRGKVVYVDFWASWCGPCAQSFPFMNELHHELGSRGLQVVGVNLDEEPGDARAFLTTRPAYFHVAVDGDGSCAQRFGVQAMPSSYLVDRKGVIRHVHLGFRAGEAGKLRKVVEQLLAEAPSTP